VRRTVAESIGPAWRGSLPTTAGASSECLPMAHACQSCALGRAEYGMVRQVPPRNQMVGAGANPLARLPLDSLHTMAHGRITAGVLASVAAMSTRSTSNSGQYSLV